MGFILHGSSSRSCNADGSWSGTTTTCFGWSQHCFSVVCRTQQFGFVVVTCSQLAAPTNGAMVTSSNTYNSTAVFSCSTGYVISGSSLRICQSNGDWSGVPPLCNGLISCNYDKTYYFICVVAVL